MTTRLTRSPTRASPPDVCNPFMPPFFRGGPTTNDLGDIRARSPAHRISVLALVSWITRYRTSRRTHPWVWLVIDVCEGAAGTAVFWVLTAPWVAIPFACVWGLGMVVTLAGTRRSGRIR